MGWAPEGVDVQDCCQKCLNFPGCSPQLGPTPLTFLASRCVSFTFEKSEHKCWLKSKLEVVDFLNYPSIKQRMDTVTDLMNA